MAFKRDWSFLDKITMGSVGTKRVIEILNAEGHQIIELESKRKNSRRLVRVKCLCQTIRV